jgi:hypothetical protein
LVLTKAGPLISLGNPRDNLQKLGAARRYAGQADWKPIFQDYVTRANMIALLAEDANWLEWEVGEVLRLLRGDRLVLLFPSPRVELVRHYAGLISNGAETSVGDAGGLSGMQCIALVPFGGQHMPIVVERPGAAHYQFAMFLALYLQLRQRNSTLSTEGPCTRSTK